MKKLIFELEFQDLTDSDIVGITLHLGEFLAKLPYASKVKWVIEYGEEGEVEEKVRRDLSTESQESKEPSPEMTTKTAGRDASIW